jgi:hypothetical protein
MEAIFDKEEFSELELESKKVQVISLITFLSDFNVLIEIEKLILNREDFIKINEWERNALDVAMLDIKAGRLTPHKLANEKIDAYVEALTI